MRHNLVLTMIPSYNTSLLFYGLSDFYNVVLVITINRHAVQLDDGIRNRSSTRRTRPLTEAFDNALVGKSSQAVVRICVKDVAEPDHVVL